MKNYLKNKIMALLLTLSMLLSLVPGMAFAAQTEGDATPQQEASAPLEDGTYSVPIYGFGNFQKDYGQLPQHNALIYPTAILKVAGDQTQLTVRVAGFKNFEKPFIVRDEYAQQLAAQPGAALNTYPVNRSELADNPNIDLPQWKKNVTAKGAPNNDYYFPSSEIVVETDPTVIDTMGYADITIPMENIEHDIIMRLYPKAEQKMKPSTKEMPVHPKNILLDIDENSARKLDPLPTAGDTTLYPYIEDGSQLDITITPDKFNSEDTVFVQALFDTPSQNNVTVNEDPKKATVTLKVKQDAAVTDIDEMTKRDITVPNNNFDKVANNEEKTLTYERSVLRKSIIDTDYSGSTAYNADDKTLTLTYDLSSYNDMVFGKRIRVKTDDGKTYYAGLALTPHPLSSKELSDNGVVFKTDNYSVPDGTAFVAQSMTEDATVKEKVDAAYQDYVAYDTKLMKGGSDVRPIKNGVIKIPIPQGWLASDIEVKRMDTYNRLSNMNFTIQGNYVEIPTAIMDKYILGLKYNYDNMDTSLEDGTWKVNVVNWHIINNEPSMADKAITKPAYLVIENGGKDRFLYLDTKQVTMNNPQGGEQLSSYLASMLIYKAGYTEDEVGNPNGDKYPAIPYSFHKNEDGSFQQDIYNANTLRFYPEHLLIKLPSDKAELPIRFRVPVMDSIGQAQMERDARLRIDYAKAEKIEGADLQELNLKPSLAALKDAFKEQKAIAQFAIDKDYKSKYTEASWNKMLSAYEEAKKFDVEKASEEELTNAFNKLYEAIYYLREDTPAVRDADKVDASIEEIGEVTLESELKIKKAREEYDALMVKNPQALTYVTKYDILVAAEARLQELKNEQQPVEPSTPDESTIPQGTYTVPVRMMQYGNPRFPSMGNQAINGDALVKVGPNGTTYSINVKGITISEGGNPMYGHLLNMWHYASDTNSNKTKAVASNYYKDTNLQGTKSDFAGTFTMTRPGQPEDEFFIEVQVDAMDEIAKPNSGKQDARLVFDWDDRVSGDQTTPVPTPELKPGEEVENKDGSITKTEKLEDGTVVETTTNKPDGSTTEKTTKPDGTTIDKTTDKEGNIDEKTTKPDGTTIDKSVKTDGLTTETTTTKEGKVSAEVTVPEGQKNVKVTIPKKDLKPGEVAVITKADGSKEVIKKSVAGKDGLNLLLDENTKLEIVDNSKTFNDVKEENWANPAIDFVTSREIFNGTGDSTFAPEATMTRGMLVQVLYNFENRPEGAKAGDFGDVKGDAWFADAVAWAADNKIVAGVGDNNFAPEQEISREQLVTILYRYAGEPKPAGSLDKYSDASKVSSYAQDAMLWAVENGIVSGMGDNTLAPQGDATRAQVAQIMMNFCDFII